MHIDVQGPFDNQGYLRLILDHDLLGGNHTILVYGQIVTDYDTTFVSYESDRYYRNEIGEVTIISIEYEGSQTRSIEIVGTSVIPEFDILLYMILTLTTAILLMSFKFGDADICRLSRVC